MTVIVVPSASQLSELASVGPWWWYRPGDQTYYATTTNEPDSQGDLFVLEATPAWVDQWGGEWQAAVDQLEPLIAQANAALAQINS